MAGISAYNSPADNTAYLQKILNAKGEVHVNLPPGSIIQLYRTLIIGSDTNLYIPAGVTIQGALGCGSLIVNYAQRLTPISCTAAYTNGDDFFVVTSVGHGLLIGESVAVTGATLNYFNGVFKIISVTIDTFSLQLIADLNITTGAVAGTLTYKKADQNVRITGGTFDFYKRYGNTGNIFTFDAVDGLFINDISIVDSDGEPIYLSSSNNADINNVNSLLRDLEVVYKAGGAITNYKDDFVRVLSAYNFGAFCDGVHDDTQAVKKAISYAKGIASNGVTVTLEFPGQYLLSDTIVLDADRSNYFFDGQLIAGATFPVNNFMIEIQKNACKLENLRVDGKNLANGIFVSASDAQIIVPDLIHFTEYGIYLDTGSGNSSINNPTIAQWYQDDPEFEDEVNFTSHGIHFAHSDCKVLGGRVAWCGVNIYIATDVKQTYIEGCHIWSGRPTWHSGGPYIDAVLVHVEDGSVSTQFNGCYFDNGRLNLYCPSVVFHDCNFITHEEMATISNSTVINVYANGFSAPVSLDLESIHLRTIPDTYKFIDFLPFGAFTWAGDYSGIVLPFNASIKANRGTYVINNQIANVIPYEYVYKPSGDIIFKKKIATNAEIIETYSGTNFTIETDNYRIQSTDEDTIDSQLYLGFDSTSIRHVKNGPITFRSNVNDILQITGVGIQPAVDGTINLGSASFRWENAYISHAVHLGTTGSWVVATALGQVTIRVNGTDVLDITTGFEVAPSVNNAYDLGTSSLKWRKIFGGELTLSKTVTAAGTTGDSTIDKSTGAVNFAGAATSLVVTNSVVTVNSIIQLTVATNDATMKSAVAVAAAGSFTIYPDAAPTAETRVNFTITN